MFRLALPTMPWIFLYRNPVEVMMSQLNVPRTSQANCVRSKRRSPLVRRYVETKTEYRMDDLEETHATYGLKLRQAGRQLERARVRALTEQRAPQGPE